MVLAQRGWRAGELTVGVQVCDEASAASPLPSPGKCARNAKAFAADPSVVAVRGAGRPRPAWGRCCRSSTGRRAGRAHHRHVEHLSRIDAGGPGRRAWPSRCPLPDRRAQLRPRGARRRRPGRGGRAVRAAARRPATLRPGSRRGVGVGMAAAFGTAATRRACTSPARSSGTARARDYRRLAERVRRAGADGVYLAGYAIADNGRTAHQGPARRLRPRVPILAPDGFNEPAALVEAPARAPRARPSASPHIPSGRCRRPGQRWAAESASAAAPCRAAARSARRRRCDGLLDAVAASDGIPRRRAAEPPAHARARRAGRRLRMDRYGDTTQTDDHRVPRPRARACAWRPRSTSTNLYDPADEPGAVTRPLQHCIRQALPPTSSAAPS